MRLLSILVALPLICALTSGCQSTTCSQPTCEGCCSSDGECLAGTSRAACGTSGGTCNTCGARELCKSGQCALDPRINPDSGMLFCSCSNGCCLADGGCSPGTQREACGPPYSLCSECGANERCDDSQCSSLSCSGCIDLFGSCQSGTNAIACGTGGALCLGCAAAQRCDHGTCLEASCNVATCAQGCCSLAQQCIQPGVAKACGLGAQPCHECSNGLQCLNGVCR